jgi:ABC-type uncharacterized transport system auxiliary subunit
VKLLALAACLAGCGGTMPATRYYQLAPAPQQTACTDDACPLLVVEPLEVERPYDDDRIVYRLDPYRVDYYSYHRWSAPPGTLVGDYLAEAFARSGRFRAIVRDGSAATAMTLGGRVIAIEEVDLSRERSVGRIVVELHAYDTTSSRLVWSGRFEETEPMPTRDPAGLARALSIAMLRIVRRAVPVVAEVAGGVKREAFSQSP